VINTFASLYQKSYQTSLLRSSAIPFLNPSLLPCYRYFLIQYVTH